MNKRDNQKLIVPGKWHIVLDEAGKVIEASYDESYRRILGYESEKEYADAMKKWENRIHPEDSQRVEDYVAEVLKKHTEGMDYDIEYRLMTKWGFRWFHDYAHVIRREDGSVERCDGVVFDIQEMKDYELQQAHDSLRKEVLDYIINHDDDPIELLSQFAEKIRALFDCDQVIYRDLEETRIMVNSPAIEKTWSVPITYCQQCQHFDAHHPMYAGGYTEMDNCQEGWQGIPVFHKCPIKSSLTRIVYCNGEVAGYLAIHYVQKYHHFTDLERKTVEDFVSNLSLILSRYDSNRQIAEFKQKEELLAMIREQATFTNFFLETYVSAYYVDLDTLSCKTYKRTDQLDRDYPILSNYYDSLCDYIHRDVHPDDREEMLEKVSPESMRAILRKQTEFNHIFRDISGGKEKVYRMQVLKGGEENHAAFGFVDITEEINEQNSRLKEAEETRKLVENIAVEYNLAYIVNMKDDSFRTLRKDDDILGSKEIFSNFTEAKQFFLTMACHPADRELMTTELDYDHIRNRLTGKRSFDVEYRAIVNGTTIWHYMNVTSISGDQIAVGFVKKDFEIVKRRLEEKKFNEYIALYVLDFDTQMIKPFKTSDEPGIIEYAPAAPFEAQMKDFASKFEEEAREFFESLSDINYLQKAFTRDEKRSFAYKMPQGRWVDFTCYVIARHDDGTPSMCAFGYSDSDALSASRNEMQRQMEENQERLKEDMEMIGGLANEYHALYYMNVSEGFFKAYSIDEKRFPENNYFASEGNEPLRVLHQFGESPLVHPDDRALFANLDFDTVLQQLAHSKKFTRRFRRKFGDEYLWTEMDFIKYEDIDTPANVIAVGFAERDAEIRHELAQKEKERRQQLQLQEALDMAQVASRSKSSFLFNMSHDIRTPINAITGFTVMAKKYAADTARVTDYLNKIDVSGQQLLKLVNQVLEMSRIESGKIEFDEKPVNVRERYEVMITVLAEQAAMRGLEFHHTLSDIRHYYVYADDSRMSQITLNIVGNAIKYTPEGGRVDFSLKEIPTRKEGYASYVFTVADTGIGMSEDFQKILYEPFAREKTSTVSKIQGTGLGMSIVKSLIDLAGGDIEVQSAPGNGTRFDITLDFRLYEEEKQSARPEGTLSPGRATALDLVASESAVPEEQSTADEVETHSFRGKRILLVEDNEMNREIARFLLEDLGLEVEEAVDGHLAVEAFQATVDRGEPHYFDLILMDVQMPTMDGLEAAKRIREIERNSTRPLTQNIKVPIIALSANAFKEDKQKSSEVGMNDHIAKPIDVTELVTTLAKFLA